MARFTARVVLPTPPFTFPREIIMLISPRYKMLSFHIIEDILSICKGNQNKVCCGGRGIEDIQIFRKYKIGRMLDVSPQAFPSPLWICGRVQHRSAPCTCAESSVPSRTCTPSVPHRCTHGKERQGRLVARAEGPRHHRPRLRHRTHRRGDASAASRPPQARARVVEKVRQSAQPPADRSVQRLIPRRRWTARPRSCPPSARQRARTEAAPCLTNPPP